MPKLFMQNKIAVLGGLLAMAMNLTATAQISMDGSLGPAGALAGPNYAITADLGQQRGGNLFHSFGQFSIQTGESAVFSGPNSVSNIIGRVTGGQVSAIDGTLRSTIPNANLYLLNPAGVLFGEHAQIDVSGSFHVSTADTLKLGDGGRFEARTPGNSVLTAAPVAAFGFLGAAPGKITINGGLLRVREGQTISLIGGDIGLRNATLFAPSGRINLAAVGSAGEVIPAAAGLEMSGFTQLGDLSVHRHPASQRLVVNGLALADVDASGRSGGAMFIRGANLRAEGGWLFANTYGDQDGSGIDLALTEELALSEAGWISAATLGAGNAGAVGISAQRISLTGSGRIESNTAGAGPAGSVTINADQVLIDNGGAPETQSLTTSITSSTLPHSTGSGGQITLAVTDTLTVQNGGAIFAGTFGAGDAGGVAVNARNVLIDGMNLPFSVLTGIASGSPGLGKGGQIKLTVADALTVRNGGAIVTSTFSDQPAGDIAIDVGNQLTLQKDGKIFVGTFGSGDGGKAIINAGNLLIDGMGSANTGISSHAEPGSSGKGGLVSLTITDTLAVQNGGKIFAGTFSVGNAGDVIISAGNLLVDGMHSPQLTGIASSAENIPGAMGAGGKVALTVAHALTVQNRGGISVSTGIYSTGDAGDIEIMTPDLAIADGNIFAKSARNGGGNIVVNADHTVLSNGSEISSTVEGVEHSKGGTVEVNGDILVILDSLGITAKANQGKGGNIAVNTAVFLHNAEAVENVLDASSEVTGNDGTVAVNAPPVDIAGTLAPTPAAYLDVSSQLQRRCGRVAVDQRNRLTVPGRGALPPKPDGPLPATSRCAAEPAAVRPAPPMIGVARASVQAVESREWGDH